MNNRPGTVTRPASRLQHNKNKRPKPCEKSTFTR